VEIIYTKEQIRTIKTESHWPFVDKENSKEKQFDLPPSSSDEEDDDLEPNPNRQSNFQEEEDEEEDTSDEDSQ